MINFEDITVHWGTAPDHLDRNMARWRQAVFQDVAITGDHRFMYFLYDPIADGECETSGPAKGPPCFVLFDLNARKFVREIPIPLRENQEGVLKFCWLIDDLPTGCPSLAVVTQMKQYTQIQLNVWSIRLTPDGLNLANSPILLFGPAPVGDDYIVNPREDVAELVLLSGPSFTVWRIDARNSNQHPVDSFGVSGATLKDYSDAFMWRGIVYMIAMRQYDETVDFNSITLLDLNNRGSPIRRQPLQPDPMRGYPPNRRQAGLALYMGRIYLTGGEIQQQNGEWFRFQDAWVLDTGSYQWQQIQCTIPLPLIEPRLTDATGGLLYIWGDCDLDDGCIAPPTHSHIIRMSGAVQAPPPSYQEAMAAPVQPPTNYGYSQQPQPVYPQSQPPTAPPSYSTSGQPGYPTIQSGLPAHPNQAPPSYPAQSQPAYPTQSYSSYPQPAMQQQNQPNYPVQGQQQNKKDCCPSGHKKDSCTLM